MSLDHDPATTTVLVTGASGFIAQHTIVRLLAAGYRVRGTIRSLARADATRAVLAAHAEVGDRLELVAADLAADDGWADAARGCRFVLHLASPLPARPPRHEDELIVPARDGALRVLRAAVAARAARVVMTSSVAAVVYGHARDGSRVYDEGDWSQLGPEVGAYEKSKTLAERAAWDYLAGLPAGERVELCTINPGLVLGPLLAADVSTSGEVVRKLLARELPGCPDIGWAVVDVRDVAAAHLAAMTTPAAAGQRFIVAIEHASMLDIARILDAELGSRGFRVPTRRVPGWVLRLVSLWDRTARLAVQELGKRQDLSSARAREVLGWQPRSLREMVIDMAESMIAHGVVPAPRPGTAPAPAA
ncbi:MAG: NAD-dependent epimerase/dehydratase family protein [Kofleriaceae bacterium]|nr:NAD-dependent epimerase/dehydratase family protein [Kofleriaceae bacterium]MCL4223636.1 NAD-dependent epimerase/dehydratase family protein [Myxococcales bacterium]